MGVNQNLLSEPTLKNLTSKDYGKPEDSQNEFLQTLGTPHIASFDFILENGLDFAIEDIPPIEFELYGKNLKIQYLKAAILEPKVPVGVVAYKSQNFYPSEARQRKSIYNAPLTVTVSWTYEDATHTFEKDMGRIPIMLKSKLCNLRNMTPAELIRHGEHADEWGGYFIIGGHEKLVRMLIANRRNYPIAIRRNGWKNRGFMFSDLGVFIRSVKKDESSTNNVLHFVSNGSARFMFSHNKSMFYAPVILLFKCLVDKSDEYIFQHLMRGNKGDQYFKVCLLGMMQSLHEEGIHSQSDAKLFIGKIFKEKLYDVKHLSELEVCEHILSRNILPHLDSYWDKFLMLSFMTRKLFNVVQGNSKVDTEDSIMLHEILTGGSLYLQVLKDKLISQLISVKSQLLKKEKKVAVLTQTEVSGAFKPILESAMNNFLATGNVPSGKYSTLNLMQSTGFVIMAENINRMRYMSHFRAVHRGSYFQEMRSSEPRQLRTDAWGFICPVHTPDGTPCGLLNHLTKNSLISEYIPENIVNKVPEVLISLGMLPLTLLVDSIPDDALTVMLDGNIIGYIVEQVAVNLVPKLRILKIAGEKIPKSLEIVFLKKEKKGIGLYPGLYLFTAPGRMLRPVINLAAGEVELIGTFEQVYMDICITLKEAYPGITTHKEISKTDFLSNLANLIPMPDCNQSPRNMYQCQMGKQTMGTPCLNWRHQGEGKLYRLQTPGSPFFRPVHYDNMDMDNFPMGTNAIVAVISYTGYDMEDAMIINKCSYERGFAHGCIFKAMFIELDATKDFFARDPNNKQLEDKLGPDGLVYVGARLKERDPLYCYWKDSENHYVVCRYLGKEEMTVEVVRMSSGFSSSGNITPNCAYVGYRIQRNPSVGDKFASRAGQKGICSVKWPAEDLPFTDSGLVPDIVFNPHGFPSRMTIAMMIELMAGKSAAVHGLVHDATPFKFTEDNTAIEYFGKLLQAGGYNYYGTETMYSGIDGSMMEAQIFFGICHYQRLRHMVSDKWQVRSKGPVDRLTHQPVKGRKKGGGVRFGEMERDGVLAHGASWVLLDRLFNSSDKSKELVCRSCGSLLGPTVIIETIDLSKNRNNDNLPVQCKYCGEQNNIGYIYIPFVLRNLVCQLASFNIHVELKLKENENIV